MDDTIKKRRNAHYNKGVENNIVKEESKDNFKIIIQLVICIVIIFCFMYDGIKNSPVGKTIYDNARIIINKQTDFKLPIEKINNLVEKVVGTPNLPVSENVFNENSVMSHD